ncbi:MAG: formylglycine-generating enzyme family protein [Rectinema sp.]|nr:formylglycine-generating enzyme family protein [Rectinema sp.]
MLFPPGTASYPVATQEGATMQVHAEVPAFGLATTEVTNRQYARFLESNPAWRAEHREELIAQGLADEAYLSGFDPARPDDKPVTGVSWYAARAYCEWLSKSAPVGWEVVLPSEAEWALAASASALNVASRGVFSETSDTGPVPVGSRGSDRLGLADMFGNVWEWTRDGYTTYPWLTDGSDGTSAFLDGIDSKVVRGGSWANKAEQIGYASRGPIPAAHASEFLGFRPALRKR